MMKTKLILLLFLLSNFLFSQSREEILDSDLYKMNFLLVNNNLPKFVDYLSYNIKINEEGFIKRIKTNREKLIANAENVFFVYYKNFSKPIKFDGKYQSAFTKVLLINTPKGKIVKEYAMVGIYDEYDKQWRFIDTSILDEEEAKVHFSTLSDKIISSIKPVNRYQFDEKGLIQKCKDYRNIELESTSPFTFEKQKLMVFETEKKDTDDNSYYLTDLIRDKENPCKIKFVLKDFKKENSKTKIGDEVDVEIVTFDNNSYYFISKPKNSKFTFFDKSTVVKQLKP